MFVRNYLVNSRGSLFSVFELFFIIFIYFIVHFAGQLVVHSRDSSICSAESDTHMHQVKELNEKNSELEVNCKKLTEQLAMLSNDLQSAEDVNLNLLEQIDNLKEEVEKKG